MSTNSTDRHIDYLEFKTGDLAGSKTFFSAVFGWEFQDFGSHYASFNSGLRGGFTAADKVAPAGPLVVLYAEDLAATMERVTAHGGTISVDTFEFPGGRRFHFVEPGGNELAVWSV